MTSILLYIYPALGHLECPLFSGRLKLCFVSITWQLGICSFENISHKNPCSKYFLGDTWCSLHFYILEIWRLIHTILTQRSRFTRNSTSMSSFRHEISLSVSLRIIDAYFRQVFLQLVNTYSSNVRIFFSTFPQQQTEIQDTEAVDTLTCLGIRFTRKSEAEQEKHKRILSASKLYFSIVRIVKSRLAHRRDKITYRA